MLLFNQVTNLDENAEKVAKEHPEEAEQIEQQLTDIKDAWESLKQMVREGNSTNLIKVKSVLCRV